MNKNIRIPTEGHSNKHTCKTFAVITLGCKVNQYESEAIIRFLTSKGFKQAQYESEADFCIINTCTVTQKSSMQSRQAIRHTIRTYPNSKIIVTGCYAEIEPDVLKQIEGVYGVVGHADKHNIPEMLISLSQAENDSEPKYNSVLDTPETINAFANFQSNSQIQNETVFRQIPVTVFGNRTRPFLKIQDGCSAFCSYCIVPYARGPSRSMPFDDVLIHLKRLNNAGNKEVVLTGIHLGQYGYDLEPQTNLVNLLRVIHEHDMIERIRLSSIEPNEITNELIELTYSSKRFCNHFHIPLQSGSDHILKLMRRPYHRVLFRQQVLKIFELIPDVSVGTDVLIGFPGETDKDFNDTYDLIQELPIAYLHVFPFSARKGTIAATFSDKIPASIIKERCRIMRQLGFQKRKIFYEKFIGHTLQILIEQKSDKETNLLKGLSSNYIPVYINGDAFLKNQFIQIQIDKVDPDNRVYGSNLGEKI